MVYKFNSKILEGGQRTFIEIPFNVWDECGRRGNIPVKVTIDNLTYECKLLPKGNGIYYIPVTKEYLKKLDTYKELNVSFELISGLSRINNNSPYTLENPIRTIEGIEIVNPPKGGMCGQACIAMLAGVSLKEVVGLVGSQCSMSKVIEALDYFGIFHAGKMVYKLKQDNELPKCCIINAKGHLMVFYDGKYYDPGKGILDEFNLNEVTGFLEIHVG